MARSRSLLASAWLWARRSPALATMVVVSSLLVLALAIGATVAALRISNAENLASTRLQNLQLEEIETFEISGRTKDSISRLADYLEDHPDDKIIRSRLTSALAHRSFPVLSEAGIRRHSGKLLDSTWTPNLVTLTSNGELTEWTDSPKVIQVPKGTMGLLHPSGGQGLVVNREGKIVHWKRNEQSKVIESLPVPQDWAASEDWTIVAILDAKNELSTWSLPEGKLMESRTVARRFRNLVFSPDGKYLAGGNASGHLMLWEVGNLSETELAYESWRHFSALTFSHDSSLLATSDYLGGIQIYSLPDGNPLNSAMQHGFSIHDLNFSSDDRFLVSAAETNEAQVWEVATGKAHGQPAPTTAGIRAADFLESEPGLKIGTIAHNGMIAEFEYRGHWLASEPQAISERTARFENYGRIRFAPPETVFHAPAFPEIERGLKIQRHASVHPDGRHVGIARHGKGVSIWDTEKKKLLRSLHPPGGTTFLMAFHEEMLATATQSGGVSIWNWQDGTTKLPSPALPGRVSDLVFSSDGSKYLVSSSRQVSIIETATAKTLWDQQCNHTIFSARFGPKEKKIITSGGNGIAYLWEIQGSKPPQEFNHQGPLFHAALSGSGSHILTASYDSTIRVWDVESGRPLTIRISIPGELTGAGFTTGSDRVVTTSAGGTFQTWGLPLTSNDHPLIKLARVMSEENFPKLREYRKDLLKNSNDQLTNWLLKPESGR